MRRMRCCELPQCFGLPTMRAGAFRFQSSNGSPPGSQPKPLAKAVTCWLTAARAVRLGQKRGNAFAASDGDQLQLDAMQRYLDGSETKAPRCGNIPFKLSGSVEHDVLRHVWQRERAYKRAQPGHCQQRTSLLCNSGCTGIGKTTLLHHTTVEA
ncbi:multi-copy leucine-rich repeat protein, putative, partial [Bodo saltans]